MFEFDWLKITSSKAFTEYKLMKFRVRAAELQPMMQQQLLFVGTPREGIQITGKFLLSLVENLQILIGSLKESYHEFHDKYKNKNIK